MSPRPILEVVKKLILVILAALLIFGAISAYRAWVQVKSLDLIFPGAPLTAGSTVRVNVVTSGRVPVNVQLELIQGARAETLAVQRVFTHREPFWDFRSITAKMSVTLSPETFARLQAGPALMRATARGRPQWLRDPPPFVRELTLQVQ